MSKHPRTGRIPQAWVSALLLVLVAVPAAWAQTGTCYVAEVPGPIVLPDDSVLQAGELEICLSRMYSPVAAFHRMSLNGRVAGMFVSRVHTDRATEADGESYFVFSRLADGSYELESLARVMDRRRVTFELRGVSVRSRWQIGQAKAGPQRDRKSEKIVLVEALAAGN